MKKALLMIIGVPLILAAACGTPAAGQLGAESENPFAPPGVPGPGDGTAVDGGQGLCVLPLPDGGCPDTPSGPLLPGS